MLLLIIVQYKNYGTIIYDEAYFTLIKYLGWSWVKITGAQKVGVSL